MDAPFFRVCHAVNNCCYAVGAGLCPVTECYGFSTRTPEQPTSKPCNDCRLKACSTAARGTAPRHFRALRNSSK